jgi:hypothetical protein
LSGCGVRAKTPSASCSATGRPAHQAALDVRLTLDTPADVIREAVTRARVETSQALAHLTKPGRTNQRFSTSPREEVDGTLATRRTKRHAVEPIR